MNIWNCPHGKAFMRSLCRTLEAGEKHVAIRLPERHLSSFLKEFGPYATRFLGSIQKVVLEDGLSLEEALEPAFMPDGGKNRAPEDCFSRMVSGGPHLLVVLPPSARGTAPRLREFLALAADRARACRDGDRRLPWAMAAVVPADFGGLEDDTGLEVRDWWGKLHPSDLEFAIEQALADITNEASYCWYDALCKGLARMDPELVDAIFRNPPVSAAELADVLREGPTVFDRELAERAWSYWQDPPAALRRDTPPKGELETLLWERGALDIDCYGKPALHPAVLVAAGQEALLEKLVIQGQMQVYLPIVQEVHGFLCRNLAGICGPDWSGRDPENFTSVEQEIGSLAFYMNYLKDTLGMSIPRELTDLAHIWREVRNTIAHGNMISCQLAIRAMLLYAEVREEFSPHAWLAHCTAP